MSDAGNRTKMKISSLMRKFFLPHLNRKFIIRLSVVAVVALVFFAFVLKPFFISGGSMLPTYGERGFTCVFRWSYLFSAPERGDIVAVSYFGSRYLLKRVLAVENDTVAFREGKLFVNGRLCEEPYVKYQGRWNVPDTFVPPGYCFVAGDNRQQDKKYHLFGLVRIKRIAGKVLF